ncbi:MAG: tRNA-dihydrouridine synthase [Candidatus Latescibacterota bacterium]|nr:tRNA-dihydrouridine synthase [Candidatus Latescibacterota bacterium]
MTSTAALPTQHLLGPPLDLPDSEPATPAEVAFRIGEHAVRPLRPGIPVLTLAPMAGIGNWVFRLLCARLGARIVGVEFINCRIVHQAGQRVERLLNFGDADIYRKTGLSLLAAQIYGNDISLMAEGARELERRGSQVVDINFGCSVPQIVRKGSCAAYLRDLDRFYQAVKAVVNAVSVPVIIKTRAGWDEDSINIVEITKRAQDAGAQAIAVHARTVVRNYEGEARWEWIAQACEVATVPILGNGDVRDYTDAMAMVEKTGCDGVQIGRAAMANPWIFCAQKGASLAQRIGLAIDQLRCMAHYKGENVGVKETRKHLVLYFRDLERDSEERRRLLTTESLAELIDFLCQWHDSLPPDDVEEDLGLSPSEASALAWGGNG